MKIPSTLVKLVVIQKDPAFIADICELRSQFNIAPAHLGKWDCLETELQLSEYLLQFIESNIFRTDELLQLIDINTVSQVDKKLFIILANYLIPKYCVDFCNTVQTLTHKWFSEQDIKKFGKVISKALTVRLFFEFNNLEDINLDSLVYQYEFDSEIIKKRSGAIPSFQ